MMIGLGDLVRGKQRENRQGGDCFAARSEFLHGSRQPVLRRTA